MGIDFIIDVQEEKEKFWNVLTEVIKILIKHS